MLEKCAVSTFVEKYWNTFANAKIHLNSATRKILALWQKYELTFNSKQVYVLLPQCESFTCCGVLDEDPRSMILGLFEFFNFRINFDAGGDRNFDQFPYY